MKSMTSVLQQRAAMDACGEDMIPLSFSQAQIVPNQSVKASYATARTYTCSYIKWYDECVAM